MQTQSIPTGYIQDGRGRLIPEGKVQEIDILRTQTVNKIVEKAKAQNAQLKRTKDEIFSDVTAFAEISAERFDRSLGGIKGNITLTSFDGLRKVVLARPDVIQFDERIQIAKDLIDECLARWSEGAHGISNLQAVIDGAFATNAAGKIDREKVLGLRRLRIDDPEWKRAMEAIAEAITVVGKKAYIRVFERDTFDGEWRPIPLDLAAV